MNTITLKQQYSQKFVDAVLTNVIMQLKKLDCTNFKKTFCKTHQDKYLDLISVPNWNLFFNYKEFKMKLSDDGWMNITHKTESNSIDVSIESITHKKLDKLVRNWNKDYYDRHGYNYVNTTWKELKQLAHDYAGRDYKKVNRAEQRFIELGYLDNDACPSKSYRSLAFGKNIIKYIESLA